MTNNGFKVTYSFIIHGEKVSECHYKNLSIACLLLECSARVNQHILIGYSTANLKLDALHNDTNIQQNINNTVTMNTEKKTLYPFIKLPYADILVLI